MALRARSVRTMLRVLRVYGANVQVQVRVQVRPRMTMAAAAAPVDGQPPYDETTPVFKRASSFADRVAIKDPAGNYTYGNVFIAARQLAEQVSRALDGRTGERVLLLCPNDVRFVISLWAVWLSGQIAVPVSERQPLAALQYFREDSEARLLMTTASRAEAARRVGGQLLVVEEEVRRRARRRGPRCIGELGGTLPDSFYEDAAALVLYTSGTTGRPKGVLATHRGLTAQCVSQTHAWRWSHADVMLHALPLDHTHGLVNGLLCPLGVGARVLMMPHFDADDAWAHLLALNTPHADRATVFTGVPTMYARLLDAYERLFAGNARVREHIRTTLRSRLRLMMSGSAPLPSDTHRRWFELSEHRLLERYGMTEIGMALSADYAPEDRRLPQHVGLPMPSVSVRLCDPTDGHTLLECSTDADGHSRISNDAPASGELLVKGPTVFREYFRRPEETRDAFTSDGWFKTGDIATFDHANRSFRLLGRNSVDIIKSGGYKISALEVETRLLQHPHVRECAVVGVDDPTWGQRVAAVVVLSEDAPEPPLDLEAVRTFAAEALADYALPSLLRIVDEIPRNAMGKVNKRELAAALFPSKPKPT